MVSKHKLSYDEKIDLIKKITAGFLKGKSENINHIVPVYLTYAFIPR